MTQLGPAPAVASRVAAPLERFVAWLDGFGETSLDHQTFYAGRIGGAAKRLYYRRPRLGAAAVAPLVFCEAFLPSSRRLFYERVRFPIADAHYAMGFAFLHEATGDVRYKERAVHFLDELMASRSPGFEDYCWGYPFDWVTRNGTIAAQTPLVTTTPYVFEAFLQVHAANPRPEWAAVLESIARHIARDIKEIPVSSRASGCSYTPFDTGGGVVNAAAYRAFALTLASGALGRAEYRKPAERNLNFVLESQNDDGSWYYAVDGVRDFVDHYHTCFVMKALAKIHALSAHDGCLRALERGVAYYREMLFDEEGLPKPFARAPRLTVYRRELYDYAECINLCVLLRDRFPELGATLERVLGDVLRCWVKPNGSFRSRRLLLGWDDVPMHRWGQAQMFRSLAYYWRSNDAAPAPPPAALNDGILTRQQETCAE